MLDIAQTVKIEVQIMKRIFGQEYLKAHRDDAVVCYMEPRDDDPEHALFVALQDEKDRPDLTPMPRKGWTVYADVYVNRETREVLIRDCQTQDGTFIRTLLPPDEFDITKGMPVSDELYYNCFSEPKLTLY